MFIPIEIGEIAYASEWFSVTFLMVLRIVKNDKMMIMVVKNEKFEILAM